jgi:hypothetical protein
LVLLSPHIKLWVLVLHFLIYGALHWCSPPSNSHPQVPEIEALRHDVEAFSKQFPTIGFEKASMRYQD